MISASSTLMFITPLPGGDLSYWITDRVADEDSGYSCAGLNSIQEVADEVAGLQGKGVFVVDLSQKTLEESNTIMEDKASRVTYAMPHAVPFDTWLSA